MRIYKILTKLIVTSGLAFATGSCGQTHTGDSQQEIGMQQPVHFNPLTELDNFLETGNTHHKKILVFFTGYACVNARKMEDNILTDPLIKTLLNQEFICFSAYADDKRPDETGTLTMGQKYQVLQHETYKSSSQPMFYILDDKGAVVSEIGFTKSTDEFIAFLNKGLKVDQK